MSSSTSRTPSAARALFRLMLEMQPITVERVGTGFVWSFTYAHGPWHGLSGTLGVWTEAEAREYAERQAIAYLAPYRERIAAELDICTYRDLLRWVGVADERLPREEAAP